VKVLAIVLLFMNFGLLSSISSAENSTLQIALIGDPSLPAKIFEPYEIWVDIHNPDEVSHHYQVELYFGGSWLSEIGYVNPNTWNRAYFSVVPAELGAQLVVVTLYQDGRENPWVERKNETITVTKVDSAYGDTLSRFDVIENDFKSVENEIGQTKNAFNIIGWVVIIQFCIIFGMAWFSYRKFRDK